MAFDGDLTKFHEEAHEKIAELRAWAISHPSVHTDILGTLQVAEQEMEPAVCGTKLIVLSDFIEDDGRWNFATDQALGSVALARRLADSARLHQKVPFSSAFLGRVRSRDSERLSTPRRDAVEAFWGELLRQSKRQGLIYADGIGSLATSVENGGAVEP